MGIYPNANCTKSFTHYKLHQQDEGQKYIKKYLAIIYQHLIPTSKISSTKNVGKISVKNQAMNYPHLFFSPQNTHENTTCVHTHKLATKNYPHKNFMLTLVGKINLPTTLPIQLPMITNIVRILWEIF